MNAETSTAKPLAFPDTKPGKLTRRIHLPPELATETHEERHIANRWTDENQCEHFLGKWEETYDYKSGWSKVWMQPRAAVLQAESAEVILRRHPRLGNFIIFRIWRK